MVITQESKVRRMEHIDATDLDGDKVMMDLEQGYYFMLNGVGGRIWDLIEKPIEIRTIIQSLQQEYEVSEEECTEQVMTFITSLEEKNLVALSIKA